MGHKVGIDETDIVFEVRNDESILDAALRQDIGFPHACGNGQCGTCKAHSDKRDWRYLDGYSPEVLSRAEREVGMVVCCKATPIADLHLRPDQPLDDNAQRQELLCRVERLEAVAPDVTRLVLSPADGESLRYRAGQYVEFLLTDGQRRAFSLATPPHANGKIDFHIRQIPGGLFSEQLTGKLAVGAELRVDGPQGGFRFDTRSARPILFIAGGTGFAPIKAMIEAHLDHCNGRQVLLYRGARSAESLYLDTLGREWQSRNAGFHYVPVVSDPDPAWDGRSGPVHLAVIEDHDDLSGFDVYMAGPPPMIKAARDVFPAYGLSEERLFTDAFVPAAGADTGRRGGGLGSRLRRLLGAR